MISVEESEIDEVDFKYMVVKDHTIMRKFVLPEWEVARIALLCSFEATGADQTSSPTFNVGIRNAAGTHKLYASTVAATWTNVDGDYDLGDSGLAFTGCHLVGEALEEATIAETSEDAVFGNDDETAADTRWNMMFVELDKASDPPTVTISVPTSVTAGLFDACTKANLLASFAGTLAALNDVDAAYSATPPVAELTAIDEATDGVMDHIFIEQLGGTARLRLGVVAFGKIS